MREAIQFADQRLRQTINCGLNRVFSVSLLPCSRGARRFGAPRCVFGSHGGVSRKWVAAVFDITIETEEARKNAKTRAASPELILPLTFLAGPLTKSQHNVACFQMAFARKSVLRARDHQPRSSQRKSARTYEYAVCPIV